MSEAITEEMKLQDGWYAEAKAMTIENLPAFIEKMRSGYSHDYGTICHAITAAAIAAAWAVERGPQGGITGFQAGAIMWEFMEHWNGIKAPARLIEYKDLLYPQSAAKFTRISSETWEFVQKKAKENLASKEIAAPSVIAHWESIVAGKVPFGLTVSQSTP